MDNKTIQTVGIFSLPTRLISPQSSEVAQEIFEKTINQTNLDLILAPEYLYGNKIFSSEEKESIIEKYKNISKNHQNIIIPGTIIWKDKKNMYNTAMVFNNGKKILEYDKQSDHIESKIAEKYNLNYETRKDAQQPIFNIENYLIGLEICREHGMDKLPKYMNKNNIEDIDMQIVIGSGMNLRTNNLASKKGLGILVDGGHSETLSPSPNSGIYSIKNKKYLKDYTVHKYINAHNITKW